MHSVGDRDGGEARAGPVSQGGSDAFAALTVLAGPLPRLAMSALARVEMACSVKSPLPGGSGGRVCAT